MCRRYALKIQSPFWDAEYIRENGRWENWDRFERYNIAPTVNVPFLRMYDGTPERVIGRWGLVPFFMHGEMTTKDGKVLRTYNARIETFRTSPAYGSPWKRAQRCVIPANGFYEWHMVEDRKDPYYIHCSDQAVFGFAGLWDRSTKSDGTVIDSCTIITMPANELMHELHNTGERPHRMPAILSSAARDVWLYGSTAEAYAELQPYASDAMVAWKVSKRVDSSSCDGDQLIRPIAA